MPPVKRKAANQPRESVPAEEKIARLLGMLLVKDMEQKTEQVTLLRSIGFEVAEVAAMLGMTENHVNVAAHHGRKNLGKKKPKK
jgi:DNA-directed RNA polymerase specialized sigma24 family protein